MTEPEQSPETLDNSTVILTGSDLTIRDVWRIVHDPHIRVDIAPSAREAMQKSHDFLNQEFDKKIIYGVNTGFGPMASYIIGREEIAQLQKNLVRSHAVGMGQPIDQTYVIASMVVRLNTLVKGYSGVSLELVEQLKNFINRRIIPIVPEHGAVGTSGDLVQLAHIALALIGEGEAWYEEKRQPVKDILEKIQLSPYVLKPKEGLSLINGTSTMTGIAALLTVHAGRLLSIATRAGALALELVYGFDDGISEKFHTLRPHAGQVAVAKSIRTLLGDSKLLVKRSSIDAFNNAVNGDHKVQVIPQHVQEFYSIRCAPQILGPVFDALEKTREIVETEMNSVTDNPIVDWENRVFLHGGNFHGDYIAAQIDHLKAALVKLTMLSERRTNFFLNSKINESFPPFLNLKTPGLTLALQGLQFVATSTTAQSQTLAYPHYLHSIPTNADNQDVVSMGTDAGLLTAKVIDNAYIVLTIELVSLAQAADILNEQDKLATESRKIYDSLRLVFPKVEDDRVATQELDQLTSSLKSSSWLDLNS